MILVFYQETHFKDLTDPTQIGLRLDHIPETCDLVITLLFCAPTVYPPSPTSFWKSQLLTYSIMF